MCSRITLHRPGGIAVACRTLDWAVSDEPRLWVLPPGLDRQGTPDGSGLRWTSRHASVVVSGWDLLTSEGVNDAGLAAHLLYLQDAAWEPADDRPVLGNTMWAQWVLDTCATVDDAVQALAGVRIVDVPARGQSLPLHLALEDRTGDAAVIEVLGGTPVVHRGDAACVLTNEPPLDDQLANLRRYAAYGGDLPLPGDVDPVSRFVRGRYFLDHLPDPTSADEALAGLVGVIRSMSVPFGAPSEPFGTYPTWWVSGIDLEALTYIFQSTRSPFAVWAELPAARERALAEGPLAVDPSDPSSAGDVMPLLAPAALTY
ncbi:MAG: linear amide C-N hydrolase [Actinomycetota bacterium]